MHYSADVFPAYQAFDAARQAGDNTMLWARVVADCETPVSAIAKLTADAPDLPCFLLESVYGGENRGRYSLIGLYPDKLWRCTHEVAEVAQCDDEGLLSDYHALDGAPLESLQREIDAIRMDIPEMLPQIGSGLIGYFGYDMVKQVERLPHNNADSINIPTACMMRPQIMLIFDNADGVLFLYAPVWADRDGEPDALYEQAAHRIQHVLSVLSAPSQTDFTVNPDVTFHDDLGFTSNTTKARYHEMVTQAQEYIRAGDIFQVVPSQRFSADFDVHPLHLYRSLRFLNPSPFLFYLHMDGFSLVGSSPEILVRVRDDIITVRPIAGTRKRGASEAEDNALEAELRADEKELSEHLMLLDLGRNDVGRAAQGGSVRVTDQMMVERYSHVMHIVSNVEGKKRDDISLIECLMSGFPAGTVSGAPKIRAMEIIDELESEARSFYAGGVGYFSCTGWMDSCITLRTALVKDGKIYVQAGGGVVDGSDPQAEYEESCNKAKAVIGAANLAVKSAQAGGQ